MPIRDGNNAIETSASPNPERLCVKAARKITDPTNNVVISIGHDYSNLAL
jgi:hypothetical protein